MSDRRLPPLIYRLGWVSFFADVSSEMIYPIVPIFLRSVLNAPVAALGGIEGAAAGIVSVMKGWSGIHSDRIGKRVPYIRWGYGLSALGKPLIALAGAWPVVLVARLLDRLGKGVRTTSRDALIADSVDKEQYGRAYGLHGAMDTGGAFVGVAIAALFLWLVPNPYRLMFVLAGIPGLISFVITLTVKEPAKSPEPTPTVEEPTSSEPLPRAYWAALVPCTIFALGNSSDTLLLLRAKESGMSEMQVVLAYGLYNLVFTVLSYPAGKLSDRIGRWRLLAVGWLLYGAIYLGFAQANALQMWPLFAVYGIYIGLTTGVNKALIAELTPKARKGYGLGLFYMVSGFAALAASLGAGLVWDRFGASPALTMGAAFAILAAVSIPVVRFGGRAAT